MIDLQSFTGIFHQLFYFFTKLTLTSLQKVIHHFDGTNSHRENVKNGSDKSGCVVEVSRVVASIPGVGLSVASDSHFACWHEKFTSIQYLLNPNISLYFMDDTRAVFVQVRDNANIHNTREHPFFFIAQRTSCVKVLQVPLTELVKLAEEIGEPKCKVAWLFHMARCGSTLIAQALHATRNCVVMSESQDFLVHLSVMARKPGVHLNEYVNSTAFSRILRAAIIFHLKDFGADQLVCIKTTASLNYLTLPVISRLFPSHGMVSLHRHGVDTAKSFWRMGSKHPGFRIAIALFRLFPDSVFSRLYNLLLIFSNGMLEEVKEFYMGNFDLFVLFYIQWVTNIVTFRRAMQVIREGKVLPVCFEDLQADRRTVMMKVFDHLGIPQEGLDTALAAMVEDSQKGSPISQGRLKDLPGWVRDEKVVCFCNELLARFNLPHFDEKFRFTSDYRLELL